VLAYQRGRCDVEEGDDDAPEGAQRAEGVDGDILANGVAEALKVRWLEDGWVVKILPRVSRGNDVACD
jgi:hypothetical protein